MDSDSEFDLDFSFDFFDAFDTFETADLSSGSDSTESELSARSIGVSGSALYY